MKAGDDDGVDCDVLLLDVRVQDGAFVEGEVAPAWQQETAEDERDDADEDEEAEDIGREDVEVAGEAERGEGQRDETVDRVDEVDEQIKGKAIEDEGVEEGDPGPFAEGAALGEGGDERVPEAPGQVVEAGVGIRAAGGDAPVEAIEAAQAEGSGDERKDKKEDFLRNREASVDLRSARCGSG